ncbi:MAG TPA: helix-turn-helix transcriptional regulator [Pseudonocardia sp.]
MPVTPTVPFLLLRHELDRLRRESGVSAEAAAQELGCRVSKISRIHLGQSRISPGDTKLLAELYGAGPELTDALLDLARRVARREDQTGDDTVYRESFRLLPELERHSSRMRMVQSEIVHGLLQTPDYIRALNEAPTPLSTAVDTDRVLRARRNRQRILTETDPLIDFSFILSESALRREYGNRAVQVAQLERLLEVSRLPNVQLQVLPFVSASPVTFAALDFELLHVPGPGAATSLDFVHIELYDAALYLEGQETVAAYEKLWGHLQAAALGPTESAGFIGKVAGEMS